MDKRRCMACGRVHAVEVMTCDCGTDLTFARPMVEHATSRPVGDPHTRGFLRASTLIIAMCISVVGVCVALVMAVLAIREGELLTGLVAWPLSAIYSLAMFYVFGDALGRV